MNNNRLSLDPEFVAQLNNVPVTENQLILYKDPDLTEDDRNKFINVVEIEHPVAMAAKRNKFDGSIYNPKNYGIAPISVNANEHFGFLTCEIICKYLTKEKKQPIKVRNFDVRWALLGVSSIALGYIAILTGEVFLVERYQIAEGISSNLRYALFFSLGGIKSFATVEKVVNNPLDAEDEKMQNSCSTLYTLLYSRDSNCKKYKGSPDARDIRSVYIREYADQGIDVRRYADFPMELQQLLSLLRKRTPSHRKDRLHDFAKQFQSYFMMLYGCANEFGLFILISYKWVIEQNDTDNSLMANLGWFVNMFLILIYNDSEKGIELFKTSVYSMLVSTLSAKSELYQKWVSQLIRSLYEKKKEAVKKVVHLFKKHTDKHLQSLETELLSRSSRSQLVPVLTDLSPSSSESSFHTADNGSSGRSRSSISSRHSSID